jgi:K+-transporting ATPase KdpF subunit
MQECDTRPPSPARLIGHLSGPRQGGTEPPLLKWEHISQRKKGPARVGIYFLAFVVLLVFVYLFYALFRPEKF